MCVYSWAMIEQLFDRLDKKYPSEIGFIEAKSAYQHLIAVILSAQTTDRQVNKITPILFSRYPGPADLASAKVSEVEKIIHSVGFYRMKAKHIIAAAEVIHTKFSGYVPRNMDDLLSVPGVGRKSANVIRGACYGLPAIIVDTHFARVAKRIGLVTAGNPDIIEREIAAIVEENKQYRFSMSVNMHGRVTCHARYPKCSECVIEDLCQKKGLL